MSKQSDLTEYLQHRGSEAAYGHPQYWMNHLLPAQYAWQPADVEALATYLLQDTEFQALKLGTWLTTPQGEVITWAVSQALPPVYRPYEKLFVQALTRAAELQQEGHRQEVGPVLAFAGLVAVVAGVVFFGRSSTSA